MSEQFRDWDRFRQGDTFPLFNLEKTENTSYFERPKTADGMIIIGDEYLGTRMYQRSYSFLLEYYRDLHLPVDISLTALVGRKQKKTVYTPLNKEVGHDLDIERDYDPIKRQQFFQQNNQLIDKDKVPVMLSIRISGFRIKDLHPELVQGNSNILPSYSPELYADLKRLRIKLGVPSPTPTLSITDKDYQSGQSFIGFNESILGRESAADLGLNHFYYTELGPMPPVLDQFASQPGYRGLYIHLPANLEEIAKIDVNFFMMSDSEIKAEGIYKLK
jgi:hypothetical protein